MPAAPRGVGVGGGAVGGGEVGGAGLDGGVLLVGDGAVEPPPDPQPVTHTASAKISQSCRCSDRIAQQIPHDSQSFNLTRIKLHSNGPRRGHSLVHYSLWLRLGGV